MAIEADTEVSHRRSPQRTSGHTKGRKQRISQTSSEEEIEVPDEHNPLTLDETEAHPSNSVRHCLSTIPTAINGMILTLSTFFQNHLFIC
jgi:ribosomal protein L6P/L9E